MSLAKGARMQMNKRILIIIYITVVLVISGFAKAQESALIDRVEFNPKTSVLSIYGTLPTPCHTTPKLAVARVDESHRTGILDLKVLTTINRPLCPDVLGQPFTI